MERVVLRAPPAGHGRSRPSIGAGMLVSSVVASAAVLAVTKGDEASLWMARLTSFTSSHQLVEYSLFLVASASLVAATATLFAVAYRDMRPQFREAAVEITSTGCTLVSVYGVRRQVRAFLPRERILDVVVVEVVWPHCVWSQVAFRVRKGPANEREGMAARETGDGAGNERDPNGGEEGQPSDTVRGGGASSQNDDSKQTTQQRRAEELSIQELLRRDRVAIVPAFPDECRGLLSYEQCLHVQAEIERKLDLPSGEG